MRSSITPKQCIPTVAAWLLLTSLPVTAEESQTGTAADKRIFAKRNLVAWCIVPFDAAKRGPQQRAQMLSQLGLKRVAYDWRAEHVPTFEQEILAYKEHDLEYFAFWSWHPDMAALIKRHGIRPQIWLTCPSPPGASQTERVEVAARQLLPLAQQVTQLGCKVGLYNHGGWGGEPESLVAVCRCLRELSKSEQIGIVYNLHHGHGHISDFADSLQRMLPYLLCLNLNGMNEGAQPKILALGKGQHDKPLLSLIARSGYDGPIGILDHRSDMDSEQALRENLAGLQTLVKDL